MSLNRYEGLQWLRSQKPSESIDKAISSKDHSLLQAAAPVRLIPLGVKMPHSTAVWDVLSESYDPRIHYKCTGLSAPPRSYLVGERRCIFP